MHTDIDAYAPENLIARVEAAAEKKRQLSTMQLSVLAVLAGAFIGFGALFFTVTITESTLGFGPTRLLGGVAFSLGLVLVVVAGAELFTGDNLMVMAWADRKLKLGELLRVWVIVYFGNFVGSLGLAALVAYSGLFADNPALATQAGSIADAKVALELDQAFIRGILCNALVCLAVWIAFAARRVSGKILAIVFPITAFVASGFEHCVANMFMVPVAMIAGISDAEVQQFFLNLLSVTAGNIIGGSAFVAIVYWLVYSRPRKS